MKKTRYEIKRPVNDPEKTSEIILKINELGGSVYYSGKEETFVVESKRSEKKKIISEVKQILNS